MRGLSAIARVPTKTLDLKKDGRTFDTSTIAQCGALTQVP